MMKRFAFLDLEGVLIPEIWEIYAQELKIPELAITTREEPDFKKLVRNRIEFLKSNGITIGSLVQISKDINPLEGSLEFIKHLKSMGFTIIIVTDAFLQTIDNIIKKIDMDHVYPNYFKCDLQGYIVEAVYSRRHGKHEVLNQKLNKNSGEYSISVGDTFNDFTMLNAANDGFLFNPSERVLQIAERDFHNLRIVYNYQNIISFLKDVHHLENIEYQMDSKNTYQLGIL